MALACRVLWGLGVRDPRLQIMCTNYSLSTLKLFNIRVPFSSRNVNSALSYGKSPYFHVVHLHLSLPNSPPQTDELTLFGSPKVANILSEFMPSFMRSIFSIIKDSGKADVLKGVLVAQEERVIRRTPYNT